MAKPYPPLEKLPTPALLVDRRKLRANIERMANRIGGLGGTLRPHVKTTKSIDALQEIRRAGNVKGITVSTLREAEYFFANGVTDILYAIGISPNKFDAIASLSERGCDIKIILDNPDMARALSIDGETRGSTFKVLIELDTDGHRSGVDPNGSELLSIAEILGSSNGTELLGVLTHAGESYNCRTPDSLLKIARQERDLCVHAAERLRNAGFDCPVVSIGSTPTALSVDDLSGVTEVRTGVYVFFDLVMAGIGVCSKDEIALSVLASVIGHQRSKGWVITDAGWMAMSRDRGTSRHEIDFGYGAVIGLHAEDLGDLAVTQVNQEHGIVTVRAAGDEMPFEAFPLGQAIRILPNHACSTASQFDCYFVVVDGEVVAEWPRISGW